MDDELKSIEVETARIHLERERLALQNDLDRRKRSAKVVDVSQTVVEATLAAGGVATSVAVTTTKIVSKAIFGAIVAGILSLAWVAAHQWKGDISRLAYDYGNWLGSGGFVFILVCAIGCPLLAGGATTTTAMTAPDFAPLGPSIFEGKANLRRQVRFWLIACLFAGAGWLVHSLLPMSITELFGGVLAMFTVALPFWALGLLMDFLRISAAKKRY